MQIKDVNFSTLLASCGHDIKNVLSSTTEKVTWLSENIENLSQEQEQEFNKTLELLALANNDLMQLLTLYKFENEQYSTNIQDQYLADFLDYLISYLSPMADARNLELSYDCDDELMWPFDEVMLNSAIRNAIMNAMLFAKSKIHISAEIKDSLVITVNDDGDGYPDSMLGLVKDNTSTVDFGKSSTGLGLHFAEQVAKLHSKENSPGYVELSNGGKLKGACFHIYLP